MTDCDAIAYGERMMIGHVQDAGILDVSAFSNSDGIYVRSHHAGKPDTGFVLDMHIADEDSVGCYKGALGHAWALSLHLVLQYSDP